MQLVKRLEELQILAGTREAEVRNFALPFLYRCIESAV